MPAAAQVPVSRPRLVRGGHRHVCSAGTTDPTGMTYVTGMTGTNGATGTTGLVSRGQHSLTDSSKGEMLRT